MTINRAIGGPRCNIGPAELARRRWIAIVMTAATVALAIWLLACGAPAAARLTVWPFATASAVTWLQVVRRFCVRYGAQGLENLGTIGEERPVDPRLRNADLRRAAAMIGEGILIGLVATIAFVSLPLVLR